MENNSDKVNNVDLTSTSTDNPVSYTHLDVYKRQGLGVDPVTGHEGDVITARLRSAKGQEA